MNRNDRVHFKRNVNLDFVTSIADRDKHLGRDNAAGADNLESAADVHAD